MKTVKKYEASDIDHKDPIHSFLLGALIVTTLTLTSKKEGEDPILRVDAAIASFLSMASEAGIVMSMEGIPQAFTEAYK